MKTKKLKTLIMILTLTLIVSVALQSLPASVQAQRYTRYILTATVNNPGAGRVTPTFGTYSYGDVVTLTEEPNDGYVFDGWYLSGEFAGKTSTLRLTMYRNYDVVAVFSKRLATLSITANPFGGGTTAPAPDRWTYDLGSSIVVKAYPNAGKVFDGWFLDGFYMGLTTEFTVVMDMDHRLDAYFANEPTVRPPPEDEENKIQSVLEFSSKSSASYSTLSADIRGALTSDGVGVTDVPILISYSVTAGNRWTDLTMVNTDEHGTFSAIWMPQVTGDYLIKATWNGNATHAKTTTTINFAMAEYERESIFSVTSNSTVSQLAFNSKSSQLSFSVTGPSGTSGYVYLYVPQSLLSDPSELQVFFDQTQLVPTVQVDGDSWLVAFTYTHSTHDIRVDLTGKAATGSTTDNNLLIYTVPVAAVVIIVLAALIVLRKRRKT